VHLHQEVWAHHHAVTELQEQHSALIFTLVCSIMISDTWLHVIIVSTITMVLFYHVPLFYKLSVRAHSGWHGNGDDLTGTACDFRYWTRYKGKLEWSGCVHLWQEERTLPGYLCALRTLPVSRVVKRITAACSLLEFQTRQIAATSVLSCSACSITLLPISFQSTVF